MRKSIYLLAIIVSCLFVSCSDDDDKEKQITVADQSQLNQTAYADEENTGNGFTFTAKDLWRADMTETVRFELGDSIAVPDWIELSNYSGDAGTYTIAIGLEPNYTGEKRSAKIIVTCNGDKITVNVAQEAVTEGGIFPTPPRPVTGVVLNKKELLIRTGDSESLIAIIEPENATNKAVKWKSSDALTASVDASSGKVTANKAGTATITAISLSDTTKMATCAVTVTNNFVSNGSGTFTYSRAINPLEVIHGQQEISVTSTSQVVTVRLFQEDENAENFYINFYMADASQGLRAGTYYFNETYEADRFYIQKGTIDGVVYYCDGGFIQVSHEADIFTITVNLNTYETDPGESEVNSVTGTYTGQLKTKVID